MIKFEDYTQTEIMDYLYNEVMEDYKVSFETAKKYVLNALSYNIIVSEIKDQIDFLIEEVNNPSDEN